MVKEEGGFFAQISSKPPLPQSRLVLVLAAASVSPFDGGDGGWEAWYLPLDEPAMLLHLLHDIFQCSALDYEEFPDHGLVRLPFVRFGHM